MTCKEVDTIQKEVRKRLHKYVDELMDAYTEYQFEKALERIEKIEDITSDVRKSVGLLRLARMAREQNGS